ncbi:MAG: SDR family oxidoreductase [Planctomycetota bacterium]
MNFDGKIALVTGAGRGIGQGCVLELARRGADVIVNDRPGASGLESTVESVRSLGRRCVAVEANCFEAESAGELVERAVATWGRIDILISNPALNLRRDFLEFKATEFEEVVRSTLVGAFWVGQPVAKHMVSRGEGGKIVFISSVQATMPFEQCAPYGASKAGLNQLTRTMSVELAKYRINVNAVEPGWTDTPGERETFGDEMVDGAGADLPWGRMATVSDIGCAAAFLASDEADYITGVTLPVDGGFRHLASREDF